MRDRLGPTTVDRIKGLLDLLHMTSMEAETDLESVFQKSVESVHQYPYLVVLEKRSQGSRTVGSFWRGDYW